MGPEETTNLGGSQERWIPDPTDHARFCISATSQTVLYMIFFKLKLVLIDAISSFFFDLKIARGDSGLYLSDRDFAQDMFL